VSGGAIINGLYHASGAIPVEDRGFTLGDGLFETIPLYGGRPFLLERRLARLRKSAAALGFIVPFEDEQVATAIATVAEKDRLHRGSARLTVSRGVGPRGYATAGAVAPLWVVTAARYTPPPEYMLNKGVALAEISLRKDSRSPLNSHKTISALEAVLRQEEAKRKGGEEGLLLTMEGNVSSAVAGNIFWLRKGELFTPSLSCAILPGITRAVVRELAVAAGIVCQEGEYTVAQLVEADEIFITNSLREITPVSRVVGLCETAPHGPVTAALRIAYRERVAAAMT